MQSILFTIKDMLGLALTHWGRVTHISVSKHSILGSDNGLLPGRRQAIIWTNAGILLIGPLWTNFSEISIEIHKLSFKKMHLKMSGKWRPFCLGLNVLTERADLNIVSADRCAAEGCPGDSTRASAVTSMTISAIFYSVDWINFPQCKDTQSAKIQQLIKQLTHLKNLINRVNNWATIIIKWVGKPGDLVGNNILVPYHFISHCSSLEAYASSTVSPPPPPPPPPPFIWTAMSWNAWKGNSLVIPK